MVQVLLKHLLKQEFLQSTAISIDC